MRARIARPFSGVVLVTLLLIITGCVGADRAAADPPLSANIVVFGDSMTAAWGSDGVTVGDVKANSWATASESSIVGVDSFADQLVRAGAPGSIRSNLATGNGPNRIADGPSGTGLPNQVNNDVVN